MLMLLIYLRNVSQNLSRRIFLDFFADHKSCHGARLLQNRERIRPHPMQVSQRLRRDPLQIFKHGNPGRGERPPGGSSQLG